VQTLLDEGVDTLSAMGATDEQLAELAGCRAGRGRGGHLTREFGSEADMAAVIEGTLEAWRTDDGELVLRDREAGEDRPEDAERVRVDIGIAFPDTFIGDVATGAEGITVTVYSDAAVPRRYEGAMTSFVREMAYQFAGRQLPVEMPDEDTIVLGTDRVGDQVSLRDKLIPMLAFMMLLIETFAMASLISSRCCSVR
jgi:ABC-2 type transport system permease protein